MGNTQADCKALLARLYEFVDSELDEAECAALQVHIDACSECLHHVEFERGLKALVRKKCSSERVPDGLTDRLNERLHGDS